MAFIIALPVLLLLLLFNLIISYSRVTLIMRDGARVEITFTLVKLELYNFGKDKSNERMPLAFYRKLYSRIIELFRASTVRITELSVPCSGGELYGPSAFTFPYGFHIAISVFIAYLRENSLKLKVNDNAVFLTPNENSTFSLILTARTRLYYLLRTILGIISDKKEFRREKRYKNVGE